MTYAYACSLQSNDLLSKDNFNKAADTLNTSASVFHFVGSNVIPAWKQSPGNRPVETIREFSIALSKYRLLLLF